MPKKSYANEIINIMVEYIKARGNGSDSDMQDACNVIASELDERRQLFKDEAWRRSEGWTKRTQLELERRLKEKLSD